MFQVLFTNETAAMFMLVGDFVVVTPASTVSTNIT